MGKFTKEMVQDYADKLLIGLTDEENELVLREFDVIETNMEVIANIDGIENVSPMVHTLDDFSYELREDIIEESVPIEELLSNCDLYDGREIEVPKVVG